jgi:hypothetical protein
MLRLYINTIKKNLTMKSLFAKIEFSLFILILLVIQLTAKSNPMNARRDVVASWTLNTGDTRFTVGVNSANKLYIYEISNPTANWNWTQSPSLFPLLSSVTMGGTNYTPNWVYQSGTVDTGDGAKLTITFTNASPAMTLKSIWHARSGPGPVRHYMQIINNSGSTVTIANQETFDVKLVGSGTNTKAWHFINHGWKLDKSDPGVIYCDSIGSNYNKTLNISESEDNAPYTIIDANDSSGIYIGWEWSIGRINITGYGAPGGARVKAGNGDTFKTDIDSGETFEVPAGFIGAYNGNIDDAGNSLRKYLYNYSMPAVNRTAGYPKVEWNAFGATTVNYIWNSFETNYRPLVDVISGMGFEEVMLDIAWWEGDQRTQPCPPKADPVDWPSGMKACSDYAHSKGVHFGLYWNDNTSMTTDSGIQMRESDAKYLFDNFGCDIYRADNTDGKALQTGGYGSGTRAHYAEDVCYWQTKGYYEVLDWLKSNIPDFKYENCSGGSHLLDFGIMSRSVKIQITDYVTPLDNQIAFYDLVYFLPPVQLMGTLMGEIWTRPSGVWTLSSFSPGDKKYWFRSAFMGAGCFGMNPIGWSPADKDMIAGAVTTYKNKIRPLLKTANVYHVFPRPDDVVWTGIEYYDPTGKTGVVYIFKPNSSVSSQYIKLKGLNASKSYTLSFEDGTNNTVIKGGSELMKTGINVSLNGTYKSELMWIAEQ